MFVHFNPSSVVGREIGWGRNAYRPGEPPGNQYEDPSVKDDTPEAARPSPSAPPPPSARTGPSARPGGDRRCEE